ncbi:hypothetical protein CACET_c25080 [Clostridium aceticum]|uniref:Uncharacterized protein n=1 Tax=Clostridium aceticum TaxID=84022 RepID=A0A0D8I9Z8_9CLOT|nr:hypothetical protein [Clostridium aceticum]AKL95953.1 hypothetical protein CACET_c25080 [Clostridium aceticum]KJF27098.1 hypothetical protein TZ02_09885 [Clostridium aceticum]
MSTAIIKPGVCGLETKITVSKKDRRTVDVAIESACPHVKKMEEELQGINGANECFMKFTDSKVYESANKHCKHLACPVPTGIIKAIEVECGLALPRDVEMKITKE